MMPSNVSFSLAFLGLFWSSDSFQCIVCTSKLTFSHENIQLKKGMNRCKRASPLLSVSSSGKKTLPTCLCVIDVDCFLCSVLHDPCNTVMPKSLEHCYCRVLSAKSPEEWLFCNPLKFYCV